MHDNKASLSFVQYNCKNTQPEHNPHSCLKMTTRRDDIREAMRLRFLLSRDEPSRQRCSSCGKKIRIDQPALVCPCKCRTYCSHGCKGKDCRHHSHTCKKFLCLAESIRSKSREFQREHDIRHLFQRHAPPPWSEKKTHDERTVYFDERERLINDLIEEGETNQNRLATDIAIHQCRELVVLKRHPTMLLNMYLSLGKLEEVYDLSCYCGLTYHSPWSTASGLTDNELSVIWERKVPHFDITKSCFKRNKWGEGNIPFAANVKIHQNALVHIFLVKYMLHVTMNNLLTINRHFMDNDDCMKLIGEFAGMKKEWIIGKKNWYWDQALEVVHIAHCAENYFNVNILMKNAEGYLPGSAKHRILSAIRVGENHSKCMSQRQRQGKVVPQSSWPGIIQSFDRDHRLLYKMEIEPFLPWVVKMFNSMAGWNVFGMNTNPSLCLTEFITEAVKACPNSDYFYGYLFDFIDCGDYAEDVAGWFNGELDEYDQYRNDCSFSDAVRMCFMIERKLAQCHFHNNKSSTQVQSILDKLPGGKEVYMADPPPDDPNLSFHDIWVDIIHGDGDDIEFITTWLPDLSKVVEALFKKGLATADNLKALFGHSGYVSLQILQLQQQREQRWHAGIKSFITLNRRWEEGYTDYDTSLGGLKIQYLAKRDRRMRFEEMRNLMHMGNCIQGLLQPSLEQFVSKFGWGCLDGDIGLDRYFLDCVSTNDDEASDSISKKRRTELDSFQTSEEACRHFFNAASLEEAIWDVAGVPRIVVLNGDKKKMEKAGWKRKVKAPLGDKSVQLGSRVAHVYSDSAPCTLWEEVKQESSSLGDDMEE